LVQKSWVKKERVPQMPGQITRSALIERSLMVLLVLSSVGLQAAIHASHDHGAAAKGTWGGEHILLKVSEKGSEVEFDCAHGQIAQPITLNKHGDFDVSGTFTPEHGGPVRRDETVSSAPARYSGHVNGDTMSLTVTLAKETVETYTLTRGASPKLMKCR